MSKLARFRGGIAKAKSKALSLSKSEKVGSAGHEIITFGSHAVLALVSKNYDGLGPIPVKADVAGIAAGGLAMMLGKGKTRKLGRSVLKGAGHALITRMVASERFVFLSGSDIPGVAGAAPRPAPSTVDSE